MGAWGTAIFSDDTASDVRDDFKDYIGDGLSAEEATNRILEEWQDSINDPDDGPVFWLALAATQWRLGRLNNAIKERAMAIIDDGSDLKRWDAQDREKRKKVLENLRAQLSSPAPEPKKVSARFRDRCDWEVGELIAYTTLANDKIIFRVIDFYEDKGGRCPVVELLDWKGKHVPAEGDLRVLRVRKGQAAQFAIGRTSERELPLERIERLGVRMKPVQKKGQFTFYLWRFLDRGLKDHFGIE